MQKVPRGLAVGLGLALLIGAILLFLGSEFKSVLQMATSIVMGVAAIVMIAFWGRPRRAK